MLGLIDSQSYWTWDTHLLKKWVKLYMLGHIDNQSQKIGQSRPKAVTVSAKGCGDSHDSLIKNKAETVSAKVGWETLNKCQFSGLTSTSDPSTSPREDTLQTLSSIVR